MRRRLQHRVTGLVVDIVVDVVVETDTHLTIRHGKLRTEIPRVALDHPLGWKRLDDDQPSLLP